MHIATDDQGLQALLCAAEHWLAEDPDDVTRRHVRTQMRAARGGQQEAVDELADEFRGPLAFGTAGLRAALGPGPARMNRVVVCRAAAGIAEWLHGRGETGRPVIIGHDARHGSARFALDSAQVLAASGFEVHLVEQAAPTPLIAFGVRHLGACAGIVVTASHNPAGDNGYKVYDASGSQIIPPSDEQIAACIAHASELPLARLRRSDSWTPAGPALFDAYLHRISSLLADKDPREVRWVHTAMHGVGASVLRRAARVTGLPEPVEVPEQEQPDPDFPTLPFPNPEEPGAMALAIALAQRTGADVAIATDPDADRCAVAIPERQGWRQLTGNELGALLADDAMRRGQPGVLARSVVSGSQIDAIAAAHDRELVITPTGFKWIGRVPRLAFGYEEAIGYCCDPAQVADKDGISASVIVLRLAAELKAEGQQLCDRLDEIDERYGVHITSQLAWRVADRRLIDDTMNSLRRTPWSELASGPVGMRDLLGGGDGLSGINALEFTRTGLRVFVRPSGTEAKLKCYLEVEVPPAVSEVLEERRAEGRRTMTALRSQVQALIGLPPDGAGAMDTANQ
ncbi:phosphomannomutase [Propionibacterium cyclohexanicum]|uniref:Phosphomannomutase n=1 Tax=Propionibacterium cyclohexanicum TaxID=64702 RepID=A0A1H9QGT0_9ACTN|nr:phospho-sugar mutase [Propionibacterium cyclohexanicum]SER59638.1 phosphomannomutase [Propionibacterium cyclohexanicum]